MFGVNSITIGGDSATEVVDEGASIEQVDAALYIMANPAGTAEDIVVTMSEAITAAAICVWQVNNLNSETAVATAQDTYASGSGPTLSLNVNTSSYGIVIGQAAHQQQP